MTFKYEAKSLGAGEEVIQFVCESQGILCRGDNILGARKILMGKKKRTLGSPAKSKKSKINDDV